MTKSDEVPVGEETRVYNAAQSIILKKVPNPESIDVMRKSDPQGCIDYLWQRKELYKRTATQWYQRATAAEKQLAELKRSAGAWKARYQKELEMKQRWKTACIIAGAALGILVVVMFTINQMISAVAPKHHSQDIPKVPTSGRVQQTPRHVLASVNLFNGGTQGSGTIISKGDKGAVLLSAAHNFAGKIGGPFWCYYPDGTYTKATLVAIDRGRDLAVATVDPKTILERAYVPDRIPESKVMNGVGYTKGQGPFIKGLNYNGYYTNSAGRTMWNMSVYNGPLWDGDSGGGVFMDDALIGLISQRDAYVMTGQNCYARRMYAISHPEIVAFLTENKDKLADCGDWAEPPPSHGADEDVPPLWSPSPSVPIFTSNARQLDELRADVEIIKKQLGGAQPQRPSEIKEPAKDGGLKRPSEIPDGK